MFLERDNLIISEAKCQVFKDGKEIQLTPTEIKILLTLAAQPGIVFSRLQLLKAALGDEYMGYERTMDSHIRNLRGKLGDVPANPRYIQTVYGFGYRFGERS
jgi:DNA-binding response OmpR family regulator